jgi:hypothetical protein
MAQLHGAGWAGVGVVAAPCDAVVVCARLRVGADTIMSSSSHGGEDKLARAENNVEHEESAGPVGPCSQQPVTASLDTDLAAAQAGAAELGHGGMSGRGVAPAIGGGAYHAGKPTTLGCGRG